MCDYSLMMVRNRLAVEGEELVVHKFKSGSVGLVAWSDFNYWPIHHRSGHKWIHDAGRRGAVISGQ
jgi:hypothetical protein